MCDTLELHALMPRCCNFLLCAAVCLYCSPQAALAVAQQANVDTEAPGSHNDSGPDTKGNARLSDAERDAEAALKELGARIGRDGGGEVYVVLINGPQFGDEELVHLEKLSWSKGLTTRKVGTATWGFPTLGLTDTRITNDGFARLPRLASFNTLSIHNNAAITDAALKHLELVPELRVLRISGAGFSGDAFKHLRVLRDLRHLSVRNTKEISRGDLEHLSTLGNLGFLELAGRGISDAVLESLKSLPSVNNLSIQDTSITDDGLKHIASLANVMELSIEDTFLTTQGSQIFDSGLKHLSSMKNLKVLHLRRLGISDMQLECVKSLKTLERLRLRGNRISDAGLANLKDLVHLRSMELAENNITNSGLEHLTGLAKLEQLQLDNTGITDDGLVHLAALAQLKELDLRDTQVTEQGIETLQSALPNCRIQSGNFLESLLPQLFSRLDRNNDGKLTLTEIPEQLRPRLLAADSNRDGAVTSEELRRHDIELRPAR